MSLYQKLQNPFQRLKGDARRGAASIGWMGISQICGLVLRLGSNLILTRLLAPEAFGLLGTALAFMTTLEWLSDMGVAPALIRHPKGTQKDYLSTGWWITLFRGTCLGAVAASCAWPAAMFYEQPELAGVLAVLALRPLLMAFRSPAVPVLRRELNYRSIFFDELSMTIGGTFTSVALALIIPSVWAIVGGTIVGALVGIVVSYVLCPMKPSGYSNEASQEICGFGRQILVNTLVMALWLNLDRLLGLKLISAADLGLYTVAWNLAAVAEGIITRACDVHFSMLSRLSTPAEQLRSHAEIAGKVSKWLMPVFAVVACLSPVVIWVLYDERYAGAGILLAVMICRLMIRGYGQLQFQFLMARSHVTIATVAYGVALVCHIAMIIPLTTYAGVLGLALSSMLSTIVMTVTQAALTGERLHTRLTPVATTLGWMALGVSTACFVAQL